MHRLSALDTAARTATCAVCGPVKVVARHLGRPRDAWGCAEAARTRQRRYRAANLARIQARDRGRAVQRAELVSRIKVERGCADCGYNTHPAALQFDHLGEKVSTVTRLVHRGKSAAAIMAEIDKCEVVCANCHAIRTVTRAQQQRLAVVEDGDPPAA